MKNWCQGLRSFLALAIAIVAIGSMSARSEDIGFDFAALEREICADPSAVSDAACRVHRETVFGVGGPIVAMYIARQKAEADLPKFSSLTDKTLYLDRVNSFRSELVKKGFEIEPLLMLYRRAAAFAAMDLVQSRLSSVLYGFEHYMDRSVPLPLLPEAALKQGVGICGNHVETFRAILAKLQISTRPVQFWWRNANNEAHNHIAVEVEIDGRWELFDVTWGATFPASNEGDRLLSAEEARRSQQTPTVNRNNSNYRLSLKTGRDPFAYLGSGVDMTVNNAGVISLRSTFDGEHGRVADFQDIPNFVGDAEQDGKGTDGTRFVTVDLEGRYDVTIQVNAVAGCASSKLMVGGQQQVPKEGRLLFPGITAPVQISVSGEDDICYAVIERVGFKPSN